MDLEAGGRLVLVVSFVFKEASAVGVVEWILGDGETAPETPPLVNGVAFVLKFGVTAVCEIGACKDESNDRGLDKLPPWTLEADMTSACTACNCRILVRICPCKWANSFCAVKRSARVRIPINHPTKRP